MFMKDIDDTHSLMTKITKESFSAFALSLLLKNVRFYDIPASDTAVCRITMNAVLRRCDRLYVSSPLFAIGV